MHHVWLCCNIIRYVKDTSDFSAIQHLQCLCKIAIRSSYIKSLTKKLVYAWASIQSYFWFVFRFPVQNIKDTNASQELDPRESGHCSLLLSNTAQHSQCGNINILCLKHWTLNWNQVMCVPTHSHNLLYELIQLLPCCLWLHSFVFQVIWTSWTSKPLLSIVLGFLIMALKYRIY